MGKYNFKKALPVWQHGTDLWMNYELSFKTVLKKSSGITLKLASSCNFRIWVNGCFVAFGPARAARGYFKVDEICLDSFLIKENNILVIDACGANVNSYYVQDQASFVIAEIVKDDEIIACTKSNGDFGAYQRDVRIRKTQRYSSQRTFTEAYKYQKNDIEFYFTQRYESEEAELEEVVGGKYLRRDVRYPQYKYDGDGEFLETGKVNFFHGCSEPLHPIGYLDISDTRKGFYAHELEEKLSDEIQRFGYYDKKLVRNENKLMTLENSYVITAFDFNMSGFLKLQISCQEDVCVYLLFDEVLTDGDVHFLRTACNCIKYYLKAGEYVLQSFEPYTMKYVKIIVKGKAEIEKVGIIQFKHQNPMYEVLLPKDSELRMIYDAAVETFLANAVDNFYDCPSRERAGWLCDSFFTARVEKILTGESVLEKAFLRNFLLAKEFPYLPKGMLPMCYPADFYTGIFIPNWSMWYALEVKEYLERTGDRVFAEEVRTILYDLIAYFDKF